MQAHPEVILREQLRYCMNTKHDSQSAEKTMSTQEETIIHTLRDCNFGHMFWDKISVPPILGYTFNASLCDWNKVYFENTPLNLVLHKTCFSQALEYFYGVAKFKSQNPRVTIPIRWLKPPMNWLKLNTDGHHLEIQERLLLRNFPQSRVRHVFREANLCADAMARRGLSHAEDDFAVFDNPPSDDVNSFVNSDMYGLYYGRLTTSTIATLAILAS
nr:uncharacterized protein LOC112013175 [Quercus suber]